MVLVLVILAVVLVALLPTILSTDNFRNRLVSDANERVGGTVELADLALSWSGEQSLAGLALWPGVAGAGDPLLALPEARFGLAILPLVSGNLDVTADLTGFESHVVLHRDGTTSVEDFLGVAFGGKSGGGERGGEGGGGGGTGGPELKPLPLKADIHLRDGTALLHDETRGLTTGVEAVGVAVTSARYADPVEIHVTARVRVGSATAPFELRASGLGADDPRWSVALSTDGLEPGAVTGPMLAAVFPLLAAAGDEPVRISSPLSLDLDLSGPSLSEALAGRLAGVSGGLGVELGEGSITGTWLDGLASSLSGSGGSGLGGLGNLGGFGELGGALGQLEGQGLGDVLGSLGSQLGGGNLLEFHGFSGRLVLDGALARIEGASLADGRGGGRPLPIEGALDLEAMTLDYRIDWTSLIPSGKAKQLLGGRAMTIRGPVGAPVIDLGLDELLGGAIQAELDGRVSEAKDKLSSKLDEALDEKLGGKAGEKLDELLGDGQSEDVKKKAKGLLGGLLGGSDDDDDG